MAVAKDQIRQIITENNITRVGGGFSQSPDLSHHRLCGSASGGSINLTIDSPFSVVVCHKD